MLGDRLTAVLPRLRAEAESMMRDRCTWSTVAAGTDPATGKLTEQETEVWSGPCRQQDNGRQPTTPEAGEATVVVSDSRIDIPVTAPTINAGMVCRITESADLPNTVGRTVRAVARHQKTYQTAQRIPVEEVE